MTVKDILAKVSTWTHPCPDATQYHFVTDSSNYEVSAALNQMINGDPVPIVFYKKKNCQKTRENTPPLIVTYQAVLHFKPQIERRHVILFSDHKAI